MSSGYVYILTNESMPGLVKIGRTKRDPGKRALELDQTGVPTPFIVYDYVLAPDCVALESYLHGSFADHRVSERREFFRLDADKAAQSMNAVCYGQVWELIDTFLPDHSIIHSESEIDAVWQVEMCKSLECNEQELAKAISYLTKGELRPALERYRADCCDTESHRNFSEVQASGRGEPI